MSRFVLLYNGPSDPPAEEEGKLISSLKNTKVIDRMPGTVLVDAAESDIRATLKKFSKWSWSPEVKVTVSPPRKRILHTI